MRNAFTINQRNIVEQNLGIDVIDACLIEYLVMFSLSNAIIKISEDGKDYFFFSHNKISEDCPMLGLKKDSIYRRLKKLCELGFLEQYSKSKQVKMTMYSLTEKIQFIYNSKPATTSDIYPTNIGYSSDTHTDENPMYSNTIYNSTISNSNNIGKTNNFEESKPQTSLFDEVKKEKKVAPKKESSFVKPTIEEIREYCHSRNNGIDAEEFFHRYESNGWMVGKTKMKSWKSCIITWEKNSVKFNSKPNNQNNYGQTKQPTNYVVGRQTADDLASNSTGWFSDAPSNNGIIDID